MNNDKTTIMSTSLNINETRVASNHRPQTIWKKF